MHPLEQYLTHLTAIRNTGAGTAETSYYPPLIELLNAVGHTLKPKVRALNQLANTGAGLPDGGLFAETQFKKRGDAEPLPGQMPERGVIEIKSPKEEVAAIADTKQVSKYWQKYRLVLVTNYRDFLVVGERDGKPVALESYRLAESETAFWALAAHPRKAATEQGERFADFLARCLRANAPLSDPKDVAWFLASYARDARTRIEQADLPALASIRASLEESLGLKFEGEKGEHFFRSTLVQTLFYGVFAGWVLWHRDGAKGKFDWKLAAWHLHVPMIRALYEQLAQASQVRRLGLEESLDLAADVLNRINRSEFFKRFEDHHAVQYFYEPFLEAFDPELRKQLGVWYTPTEIVRYMVARVDQALQTELGLADGLADPNVVVLDPCCGTGAYLVEVLRVIGEKQKAKGEDALAAQELKRAMTERIFGFELLPAPFVIAHLQIGLLLSDAGAPLAEDERAGVYLTNALTGWEPPKDPKTKLQQITFPELQAERDLADHVKRDKPILVIIGNPPYNGYAGMAVDEERDLSDAYRTTVKAAKPQGQGLNDLYVRFYRMAERRIVEQSGQGVVCFISNYSWLDGLSFTGMRERFLDVYDKIWIDNLHGDRIISEYAPDGRTSETVFAMQGSSPGIKVGTAIATFVRTKKHQTPTVLNYRDFDQARAEERRAALVQSTEEISKVKLSPDVRLGFPFKPRIVGADYHGWPQLPDLFPTSYPGVQTARDEALIDIDREKLVKRMRRYFDARITDAEIKHEIPALMDKSGDFDPLPTRARLSARGLIDDNFVRFCYRPFDNRWLYWEPETNLLDRNRADYFVQIPYAKHWLCVAQSHRKEFEPCSYLQSLGCRHVVERGANFFPLHLSNHISTPLRLSDSEVHPNVTAKTSSYLSAIEANIVALFFHTLAITHANLFHNENAGALRQNWPRIPLPASPELLEASAALGTQLAALMDIDTPVAGVTSGAVRAELKSIAVISRVGGGSLNPDKGELALTAGWGHSGKGGVTMPGKGKVVVRAVGGDSSATPSPQPSPSGGEGASQKVVDVYLNGVAYWKNIPEPVWEFTLGGYQVMKKWLSYRERALLGRDLSIDEAKYLTEMARRIAAILALAPALDDNYCAVKANTYAWPR